MSKHLVRKLVLATTLTVLSATAAHASSTNPTPTTTTSQPPPTPDSVTGGDPEPTSPKIIQVILTFLHLT